MEIRALLWDLLSSEYWQTTSQLVAAFRNEHPNHWKRIAAIYSQEYNLCGCGELMSPVTAISIELEDLAKEGRVQRSYQGKESSWIKIVS